MQKSTIDMMLDQVYREVMSENPPDPYAELRNYGFDYSDEDASLLIEKGFRMVSVDACGGEVSIRFVRGEFMIWGVHVGYGQVPMCAARIYDGDPARPYAEGSEWGGMFSDLDIALRFVDMMERRIEFEKSDPMPDAVEGWERVPGEAMRRTVHGATFRLWTQHFGDDTPGWGFCLCREDSGDPIEEDGIDGGIYETLGDALAAMGRYEHRLEAAKEESNAKA